MTSGRMGGWNRRARATVALVAMTSALLVGATAAPRADAVTYPDWPTFLQGPTRSSATTDPNLSVALAPRLQKNWAFSTTGPLAASASIVGTTAYVGSWDGYEYAIDTTTGAQLWKQDLGLTVDERCEPETLGITSAAAVVDGVVYVGGGKSYWYALDAATGDVLWKVFTGTPEDSYYNWASPLIVNGSAYIGIASNCDEPLVQGELWRVDLATHDVVASYKFVPDGQIGGGIWTSPTFDAATNTIFVSTGTKDDPTQTESQAVVSLDATTLARKSAWQLPISEEVVDSDWGTTPTLFTDAADRQLFAAANKNGVIYAFDRSDFSSGPVWKRQIATPGACPTCGDGVIASGVFANGVLYFGGGRAVVNGQGSGGSVRALDPATGAILWTRQTDNSVIGAPAMVNGMLAYAAGPTFEVVDASNGRLLYSYTLPAPVVAAVSVARSQFYVAALDGKLYAFGLGAAPPAPPADPNCPSGFMCRDIGAHTAGSESTAAGVLTVKASGTPFNAAADKFRSIAKMVTGNFQSSVTLTQQSAQAGPPQAGLMVRQRYGQSTDAAAPFFAVLATPNEVVNGQPTATVSVSFRSKFGTAPVKLSRVAPANRPVTLMIQRVGNVFSAGISSDGGAHYKLIPGSTQLLDLPATTLQGLAVSSGTANVLGTASFKDLLIGQSVTTTLVPMAPAHACPATWTCADIGNPAPLGDTTGSGGNLVLAGTGKGFVRGQLPITNRDSFHFVYRSVSGDHSIRAKVTTAAAASTAQAGVMMRASAAPSAPVYAAYLTAGGSVTVNWRAQDAVLNRYAHTVTSVTSPAYLKVTRTTQGSPATTVFRAYTSPNGTTWTLVPGSAVSINMGAGAYLTGIAATSASTTATTQATFGGVTIA